MAKYVYPAIFTEESDGGFSINFPDISGCYTQGNDMIDGMDAANDVLCLRLYHMEKEGCEIPAASSVKSLVISNNQFVTLINCDTLEYRKFYEKKAIKKTLTIPAWLNEIAEKEHINFSSVLQEALKERLNVQ